MICFFKSFFFMFFTAESTGNHNTGQQFSGHKVHPVNQHLQLFKSGHCYYKQQHNHQQNHTHRQGNNPAHGNICLQSFQYTADTHNRCKTGNTKQHGHHRLHLLDIIGASGDQRSGGKPVHLRIGKAQNIFKHFSAQLHADLCRRLRRQISTDDRRRQHKH